MMLLSEQLTTLGEHLRDEHDYGVLLFALKQIGDDPLKCALHPWCTPLECAWEAMNTFTDTHTNMHRTPQSHVMAYRELYIWDDGDEDAAASGM